jgi:hypothetical protein
MNSYHVDNVGNSKKHNYNDSYDPSHPNGIVHSLTAAYQRSREGLQNSEKC